MKEYQLKYGCNPQQSPARIYMESGELPLEVLNGRPGYINYLDALNGWQLVSEIKAALGLSAATSFKHVSPAGAAVGNPLSAVELISNRVADIDGVNDSPLAAAYARARGADRMCSFGDWISLSDECDEVTASIIKREVSDGIIAPGYTPKALEILKSKRNGNYNIVQIDKDYVPAALETKQVFGITFEQGRNNCVIDKSILDKIVTKSTSLPETAVRDLLLALITLKYTQSNSVCYTFNGQTLGVGAGQQSRIHCTRLAGNKADVCRLRQHPRVLELPFISGLARAEQDNATDCFVSGEERAVLNDTAWPRFFTHKPQPLTEQEKRDFLTGQTGVALGSDAFFPFSDNIERAVESGVTYVAQPGGSIRDDAVIAAADAANLTMCFTGLRLFHH